MGCGVVWDEERMKKGRKMKDKPKTFNCIGSIISYHIVLYHTYRTERTSDEVQGFPFG